MTHDERVRFVLEAVGSELPAERIVARWERELIESSELDDDDWRELNERWTEILHLDGEVVDEKYERRLGTMIHDLAPWDELIHKDK